MTFTMELMGNGMIKGPSATDEDGSASKGVAKTAASSSLAVDHWTNCDRKRTVSGPVPLRPAFAFLHHMLARSK